MTASIQKDPPLGLGHSHDAALDDALAFTNTLEFSSQGSREDFRTPADVLGWLLGRGLIHAETVEGVERRLASRPADGEAFLEHARAVRSAFRELIEAVAAGRPAAQASLDSINGVLRQGYDYELVPAPGGAALGHRHADGDPGGAFASLAGALVRDLRDGRPERLKVCANDQCRWVFQDMSSGGRRKWCDMTSCGNRAKARRHRERQRDASG
ncbi:MAG: CGNR zinc finger domain-containing protein [Candidatus Limnocylindrales bacterium]